MRSLQTRVQATDDPIDHSASVDGVVFRHRLFSATKAASPVIVVRAESGDPKRLWRVFAPQSNSGTL